jgi:hypothetical protein
LDTLDHAIEAVLETLLLGAVGVSGDAETGADERNRGDAGDNPFLHGASFSKGDTLPTIE